MDANAEKTAQLEQRAQVGRPCWAGFQAGKDGDMAALAVLFPNEDGSFDVTCELWARNAQFLYGPWKEFAQQGLIHEIAGYEPLASSVRALAAAQQLQGIGYDAWETKDFLIDLAEDGLPIKEVRLGWSSISPATKEVLRLKKEGCLHFTNPALSDMFEAVLLAENWEGDCKIDLRRSGVVGGVRALIMAMALHLKAATPKPAG